MCGYYTVGYGWCWLRLLRIAVIGRLHTRVVWLIAGVCCGPHTDHAIPSDPRYVDWVDSYGSGYSWTHVVTLATEPHVERCGLVLRLPGQLLYTRVGLPPASVAVTGPFPRRCPVLILLLTVYSVI